jgi:hypothetical protein
MSAAVRYREGHASLKFLAVMRIFLRLRFEVYALLHSRHELHAENLGNYARCLFGVVSCLKIAKFYCGIAINHGNGPTCIARARGDDGLHSHRRAALGCCPSSVGFEAQALGPVVETRLSKPSPKRKRAEA